MSSRLYWVFAGSIALAAIFGGLVVFFVIRMSAPGSETVAAGRPPQSAAPSTGGTTAGAGPIIWNTVGTYGSWQVRCQKGNAKVCSAMLQVINGRSKQVLLAWIVGLDNKGALETVMQTPTGVMVSAGIDVKLGGAAVRHINYLNCLAQGCSAAVAMDDSFVKDAAIATKADIVLYASNGKSLDFGIPLTGFDKAVAALKRQ